MKKQLLLLMMMLLPMVASADAVVIDGIYYNLVKKLQTAEVTSNPERYVGNLVIPETVSHEGIEYNVTSIGNAAFNSCTGLVSIIIGDNVTTITNAAFRDCTGLTSLIMGRGVTTIKRAAFRNCRSLTSITIPSNVKEIEYEAFLGCTGLTSVHIESLESWCNISFDVYGSNPLEYAHHLFLNEVEIKDLIIPNSIKNIGSYAFYKCTGITSITLPDDMEIINEGVFAHCINISSVDIPNNVVSIGNSAFSNCIGITSLIIPSNVNTIGGGAFSNCTGLKTLNILDGVTSIGGYAFEGCTSLTSLTIPNSVKSIGSWSFSVCQGLTFISIGSGIETIGDYAFCNCPELTDVYCYSKSVPNTNIEAFNKSFIDYATLHVPQSAISLYESAVPWKDFKNIVKIDMPKHILNYLVDGMMYRSFEIEEGEYITPEPQPTKEGFTFSGWSEIPETMPAHDVTVTGTFTINKYELTYTVDGEEYKTYEVEYGATITPEAAPTKEGYTFSGWSEIPETMPAHNVTVTGTFSINKYKLTYVVDGAEYKTYEIEYGAAITPEAEPTKEGYTFSGWSEIPETMPAHDVTVTGTFNINSYKLTYTVDGSEYKSYEVEYGAAITAEAEPTKEGYTFSGWSDIPSTMPPYDVTVTGSFSINSYKLTYMIDDKVYKEMMYEYGFTITPEPQPEGDYQTFEWKDLPQTMPAHDVVVYASYTSGIIEVLMASQQNVRIYSPNGKKLNKFQKGLNIVILCDGTIKKVIMK